MTEPEQNSVAGGTAVGKLGKSSLVDALSQHLSFYHKEMARLGNEEESGSERKSREVVHSEMGE